VTPEQQAIALLKEKMSQSLTVSGIAILLLITGITGNLGKFRRGLFIVVGGLTLVANTDKYKVAFSDLQKALKQVVE
jgi:hypothetical protein